jgi:type IV pilus assembly protein PilY1
MIAVGANDGMLHIFHAQTGQELLAYVPNAVFSHLPKLTNPLYRHRYYVDGAPSVGDVQVNGAWRTVLVSGLRAGGQGYFALDVTNPANFTDAQAANVVMWEFTDANDADLGLTFSQPSLVLMANGQWAAVFGNGYNNTLADAHVSTTGHAVLYIAFLHGGLDGVWTPGTDFIKISTQVGEITTPNGLSTPTPVDVDGDFKTDYIVAGDIRGNVWTFDVHDPNPGNWKAAYTDGSGKPTPLFTAKNASGVAQPIVSRPEVGQHPDRLDGFVVYVGTGKYLGSSDINDATGQTFYGVWDNLADPLASPARTSLLRQTVVGEVTINGQQARITSDNEIDWTLQRGWYIDLPGAGERQVSDSILRNGRIIFTTLIPNTAVCTFGGTGWLMELDVRGGRRLEFASFDFNQDQQFTDADLVSVNIDGSEVRVAASGIKSSQGIIPTPSVLSAGNVEFKFASGSEGGIFVAGEHPGPRANGRIAWKQRR